MTDIGPDSTSNRLGDKDKNNELSQGGNDKIRLFCRYLDEVAAREQLNISTNNQELTTFPLELKQNDCSTQTCEEFNYDEIINGLQVKQKHLEILVSKHLKTIDQLLTEKLNLTTYIDELICQFKNREERYESTCKAMASKHIEDIRKVKDMTLVNEKRRYEEMMTNERKKIKEITIVSMQQRLDAIEKENTEILNEIRSTQEKELQHCHDVYNIKLQAELGKQKLDMLKQHNNSMEGKMREIAKNNEELLEEQKQLYFVKQKEWEAIIEKTKIDCLHQIKNSKLQLENEHNAMLKRNSEIVKRYEHEFQVKSENLIKLKNEEMESFRKECTEQMNTIMSKKEKEIYKLAKQERDIAIENVIDKMVEEVDMIKKIHKSNIETAELKHQDNIEALMLQLLNFENVLKKTTNEKTIFESKFVDLQKEICTYIEDLKILNAQNDTLKNTIIEMQKQNDCNIEELQSRVKQTMEQKDAKIRNMHAELIALQTKQKEAFSETESTK